jgi:uncharacterized protein YlxP (DUF503 family)
MVIGVGRIVLDFFNNEKAALKNRKLDELCADLRRHFNVSALEIADFDDPERCVIGFAAVIPENWKTKSAHSLVEKICTHIDQTSFARVMVEDCDLLEHGAEK